MAVVRSKGCVNRDTLILTVQLVSWVSKPSCPGSLCFTESEQLFSFQSSCAHLLMHCLQLGMCPQVLCTQIPVLRKTFTLLPPLPLKLEHWNWMKPSPLRTSSKDDPFPKWILSPPHRFPEGPITGVGDRWAPGLDSWYLSSGIKFKLCSHPDTPRTELMAEAELCWSKEIRPYS